MDLTGKHVVVLGGTSGIGLATARLAADTGARVTVASRCRDKVAAAVAALPPTAAGHVVDATDERAVRDFLTAAGPVDHLVHTAGEGLLLGDIGELDAVAARAAFEVRFWGAWAAAKHARPVLRDDGSILLSTGIAGSRPQAGGSVVAAVCGAVESLTRALAVEFAPVRVNAVSCGPVRTALWDDVPEPELSAVFDRIAGHLPVGRMGLPDDIARAHLHLMCEPFTTGTVRTVDGGSLLR